MFTVFFLNFQTILTPWQYLMLVGAIPTLFWSVLHLHLELFSTSPVITDLTANPLEYPWFSFSTYAGLDGSYKSANGAGAKTGNTLGLN